MNKQQLIVELQSAGLKLASAEIGAAERMGGAGTSDHKAVIDGTTVMVPIVNSLAANSLYTVKEQRLQLNGTEIGAISFPPEPKFYSLTTSDGVPYKQIALLHSKDILATTVLQTCKRYGAKATPCQFCAIRQSLAAGRTIALKTP